MNEDSLGERMKRYEGALKLTLPPRMPAIIRVDGRAFHTYTRGLKPFDLSFKEAMDKVAKTLCKEVANCKLAFVQSDEISLLMCDYHNFESQPYFGGVIQKITSVTAALAAVTMTLESPKFHTLCLDDMMAYGPQPCTFDSRVFVMPQEDVVNYFIWRQQDWTRNSVQMMARAHFSQAQCQNKDSNALKDMLVNEKGRNWNNIPTWQKRGRVIRKMPTMRTIPKGPMAGQMVEVEDWAVDNEPPIFTQDRYYLERLFVGVPAKEAA